MKKLILPESRAYYDDDFEDEYEDEPSSSEGVGTVDGTEGEPVSTPRFRPVWTGLITENGRPIIKHPVVMRMGFHPREKKLYFPTLEDSDDDPILGWSYGVL